MRRGAEGAVFEGKGGLLRSSEHLRLWPSETSHGSDSHSNELCAATLVPLHSVIIASLMEPMVIKIILPVGLAKDHGSSADPHPTIHHKPKLEPRISVDWASTYARQHSRQRLPWSTDSEYYSCSNIVSIHYCDIRELRDSKASFTTVKTAALIIKIISL